MRVAAFRERQREILRVLSTLCLTVAQLAQVLEIDVKNARVQVRALWRSGRVEQIGAPGTRRHAAKGSAKYLYRTAVGPQVAKNFGSSEERWG